MILLKRVAIFSLHLIFLISIVAYGQQIERHPKEVYANIGENAYIKEWLVIGPFPRELETDFLKDQGGEANIHPYEGMRIVLPDGKNLTWKRYKSQTDVINLIDAIGKYDDAVAYAACNLVMVMGSVGAKHSLNASNASPSSPLEMLLGADDGIKVWLNGKLIHTNPSAGSMTPDEV